MQASRYFENITGYSNALPQRATVGSAGYDIASAEDVTIAPGEIVMIKTGIKAYMQQGEFLAIYPRSSLGIKRKLVFPNYVGIVDADYYNNADNEGHIHIPLWNFGDTPQHITAGERISQGIFQKYSTTYNDKPVKQERMGGFGSTGC